MSSHINVLTQAVETGEWFPVISYYPLCDIQRKRASEMVDALRTLGLKAKKQEVGT
ncbi:hypothetical protein [Frigoribacterium sp. RIT-PI-h]|uniref:hypothetical protein n=1 Tax=Frigoribacterium sp. RIT-PI-h TaxID=1690245 RepID=UPI000A85DABA|nr:hypothetical protein [Frigoribacterium sp. RIT-PI-h]